MGVAQERGNASLSRPGACVTMTHGPRRTTPALLTTFSYRYITCTGVYNSTGISRPETIDGNRRDPRPATVTSASEPVELPLSLYTLAARDTLLACRPCGGLQRNARLTDGTPALCDPGVRLDSHGLAELRPRGTSPYRWVHRCPVPSAPAAGERWRLLSCSWARSHRFNALILDPNAQLPLGRLEVHCRVPSPPGGRGSTPPSQAPPCRVSRVTRGGRRAAEVLSRSSG